MKLRILLERDDVNGDAHPEELVIHDAVKVLPNNASWSHVRASLRTVANGLDVYEGSPLASLEGEIRHELAEIHGTLPDASKHKTERLAARRDELRSELAGIKGKEPTEFDLEVPATEVGDDMVGGG